MTLPKGAPGKYHFKQVRGQETRAQQGAGSGDPRTTGGEPRTTGESSWRKPPRLSGCWLCRQKTETPGAFRYKISAIRL